jgi:hypothetical protein
VMRFWNAEALRDRDSVPTAILAELGKLVD